MVTKCNICCDRSVFLFETKVLNKYTVKYYKCQNCGFIQTENPYWLSEAYASPIGIIDVGLLSRNFNLAEQVSKIIDRIFPLEGSYLDYGGGYGVFVRLMRDKGYNFYLYEQYAQNLFAQHFELKDSPIHEAFDCVTSFEVFEHLQHPLNEIVKLFELSEIIIFSTELQPVNVGITNVDDWWYFVPEGGQHVSLYSYNSLLQLKEQFKCYLYSNKKNLHILSKKSLIDPFEEVISKRTSILQRLINNFVSKGLRVETTKRESLMMKDFEFLSKKVINGKI